MDDEETIFAYHIGDTVSNRLAWSDEGGQAQEPMFIEQLGDVCGASKVFTPFFDRVPKVLVHSSAHAFPIEYSDSATVVEEGAFDGECNGCFSGAGKACEEESRWSLSESSDSFLIANLRDFTGGGGLIFVGGFPSGQRLFGGISIGDHASADCRVGDSVDDDEGTGCAVASIRIEVNRLAQRDGASSDFVELQIRSRCAVEGVDVDAIFEGVDLSGDGLRRLLEQIRLTRNHRLGGHPDDGGIEAVRDLRDVTWADDHIPARAIDFVFEHDGDRLRREGFFEVAIECNNPFHLARTFGGEDHDLVPFANDA